MGVGKIIQIIAVLVAVVAGLWAFSAQLPAGSSRRKTVKES